MYAQRPQIALTLQPLDKWLEVLAVIGCVCLWVFCLKAYSILPETIPTHFNFKGVTDRYGSKANVFAMPIIATIIYLLMTFLNKYPHIFNYVGTITQQNAERQYRLATRLLRIVKLIVILVLGSVSILTVKYTNNTNISQWIGATIPIMIAAFMIPTVIYIYKTTQTNITT